MYSSNGFSFHETVPLKEQSGKLNKFASTKYNGPKCFEISVAANKETAIQKQTDIQLFTVHKMLMRLSNWIGKNSQKRVTSEPEHLQNIHCHVCIFENIFYLLGPTCPTPQFHLQRKPFESLRFYI